MRPIALTGGIGAGKSEVGLLLRQHGAFVIDADQLARDVVNPGTAGYASVVAAFGPEIVGADGQLDRAALADRVFDDAELRSSLEAIVHPLVATAAADRFRQAPAGALLVYEVPLLAELDRGGGQWSAVVVVDADDGVRIARLVTRGMTPDQARSRMAAQASRADRLAVADFVINNDSTMAALEESVARLWPTLLTFR